MTTTDAMTSPWYRQGWPWFLISLPAAAVLASFATLYLAIVGSDSMVVDDYYKEGRAINQRISRDVEAVRFGLTAELMPVDGTALQLVIQAAHQAGFDAPAVLTVRWVHVTEASRDHVVTLDRVRSGEYRGQAFWPTEGRWRVHVEEPEGRWRLVSALWTAGKDRSIRIEPRADAVAASGQAGALKGVK